MADRNEEPLADLGVVALYPGRLSSLAGRHGIRFRTRRKAACTVMPCDIAALDGRSVAAPRYQVPVGTPNPAFRLQLETRRVSHDQRRALLVLLSADPRDWRADPEQTLLSPIFDDGHRMIFEFRRAYAISVERRGQLEARFVAVDPVRGIVGTKTVYKFDTRLLSLAMRCVEHLQGAIDLFPMRERIDRREPVPDGEANLRFDRAKSPRDRPASARPVAIGP